MKGMGRTVLYLCLLFGLRVAVELLNDHATQYLLMIIFLFLGSLGIIWGLRRVFGRTAQGSEKDLNLLRRLAPSCLMLLGMVFLFCFPFTRTFAEIKQHRYEERREEVISAIEQGRLLPDRFGVVELPEGLKQISLDGEVEVYELSPERSVIGFWVFRGMPDGASAMVHCSDGQAPDRETLQAGALYQCEPMGEGWYYVSYD